MRRFQVIFKSEIEHDFAPTKNQYSARVTMVI